MKTEAICYDDSTAAMRQDHNGDHHNIHCRYTFLYSPCESCDNLFLKIIKKIHEHVKNTM